MVPLLCWVVELPLRKELSLDYSESLSKVHDAKTNEALRHLTSDPLMLQIAQAFLMRLSQVS